MRKILEIDVDEVYRRTGVSFGRFTAGLGWLDAALSESQLNFLKDKHYVIRPHPKKSTSSLIIELFVDEHTVDNSEWSMLYLLFNRGR